MKIFLLLIVLSYSLTTQAADLPTVTIEHLFYLESRAERVEKLGSEQMISYCIAQKIGGSAFENVYTQLFSLKMDLIKLRDVQDVLDSDQRIVTLKKTIEVYSKVLQAESKRVQDGIVLEGQVASDTLVAIARAQNQT